MGRWRATVRVTASIAAASDGTQERRPVVDHTRDAIDYRETAGVQSMHVTLRQEMAEPRASQQPVSLWLLVLGLAVILCAGFYLGRYSGDFASDSLDIFANQSAQEVLPAVGLAPSVQQSSGTGAVVKVAIRNMQFSPVTIEITAGEIVEWTNEDITAHTVTFASFGSGSIEPDATWRHTFAEAGTVAYSCASHPDMKASVVVKGR